MSNNGERMKILIVEDDAGIAGALQQACNEAGYISLSVDDFTTVLDCFHSFNPQLLLLDLMLPYKNGYYWCQEIRKVSNLPIVFISSRSESFDLITALQFGADDYITKPLDLDMCMAKIQALLRRTYNYSTVRADNTYLGVELSLDEASLIYGEHKLDLTKTEMQIMAALIKAKGAYVSREKLMEQCWRGDSFIDDNTLAVNMVRLRKKLAELDLPWSVATKKSVGYALEQLPDQHG